MFSVGYTIPAKNILISSGDGKQKAELLSATMLLVKKGYSIFATGGTYKYLCDNKVPCSLVYWPSEEGKHPQALQLIHDRKIDLVINIPKNLTSVELENGYKIRRASIDFNIPLITNTRLAAAFIIAFCTISLDEIQIKSWDEYK